MSPRLECYINTTFGGAAATQRREQRGRGTRGRQRMKLKVPIYPGKTMLSGEALNTAAAAAKLFIDQTAPNDALRTAFLKCANNSTTSTGGCCAHDIGEVYFGSGGGGGGVL